MVGNKHGVKNVQGSKTATQGHAVVLKQAVKSNSFGMQWSSLSSAHYTFSKKHYFNRSEIV